MKPYLDILLPLSQPLFTFRAADELAESIVPGDGVAVQFGPRKFYQGIVWRVHNELPATAKTIKDVHRKLYAKPLLTPLQMRFWEWLADYYMCTLGDVMRAALPAAMKPEGFSEEEFSGDIYRPRRVQYIGLHPAIDSWESLHDIFEKLRRAKKQSGLLLRLTEELAPHADENTPFPAETAMQRDRLQPDPAALASLIKKDILRLEERLSEPEAFADFSVSLPQLTPAQQAADAAVKSAFSDGEVVLLHGVTGSGKTELYMHAIARCLARGEDVLYLLPEIALTSQLIDRLRTCFGDRVIPYHSKCPDSHRAEIYRQAATGGGQLVVGVRAALFLPLPSPGLIVIDEEHESSFKQSDPAPRYHARDAALMLARLTGARTLLGSATPSIESYLNALSGKYHLVTLTERYGGATLPRMMISDTLASVKRGERRAHFNRALLERITATLAAGHQAMLFQNRRGFSPYIECSACNRAPACPHCNVTLTWHKGEGRLRCHYCGHTSPPPRTCPECGAQSFETRGFGTEKIEEELQKLLPEARIARLDRDTTRSEGAFRRIITAFEHGETDILVGTQMITKGFDFSGVSLVGILNADNLLNYPDFRASERAFQLMSQVAGRAGRRETPGEVVIQTAQPQHPVILQVAAGNYDAMARTQLAERQAFLYPPYCRLISITLKHRDKPLLWRAAEHFFTLAHPVFGGRLLGPEAPPVDRIRNEYLVCFLLKIEREKSFARARALLAEMAAALAAEPGYKSVTVVCNVDPV